MATITISATTIPDFHFSPTPTAVYLRVYLLNSFITSAGVPRQASAPDDHAWYKQVTCSLAGTELTVPSFTLDSTTDGMDTTNAKYGAYFYDQNGKQLASYDTFTQFRLSHLTANPSWQDIRTFNHQRVPVVDNTTYTKLEVDYLIAAHGGLTGLSGDVTTSGVGLAPATLATVNGNVGTFTRATITVDAKGRVIAAASGAAAGDVSSDTSTSVDGLVTLFSGTTGKIIKRATDVATFISAPSADPGQGNTTTVSMMKGADSTAASPLSSNNPSIYFQTIRSGGTHGVAMFGNLWNFQLTGLAAADTYADYLISRVSPDMTGAPTGEYYHLGRRNYIILRPTNFGSSAVVAYGEWNQGETQVTGVACYGTQTDCNNNSGSDMAHEDFSSKFKGACIATNFTSTNNVSAIIYSQGATNTAAYKGWKVAPNAVIRHILDFSEAFYSLGGTVAVTNGSGAIVGTGTKFLTDLVKGDQLQFVGVPYTITAIADNTHATISPVYAGSTASGLSTAKYVTPLRMAPMCYITAYNGALDFRFAGLDSASRWQIDPDGRSTIFGGIVQVPSPLQIGGNTSAEIALKRTGTQLQTRLGDDSAYASFAASFFVESEGNVALGNGDNNDIAIGNSGAIRFSGPSGAYAITGFQGGAAGRKLTIYNISAQACTIKSDAGSSAANRIYTLANGANSDVVITAYGSAMFVYSSVDSRWILTGLVK